MNAQLKWCEEKPPKPSQGDGREAGVKKEPLWKSGQYFPSVSQRTCVKHLLCVRLEHELVCEQEEVGKGLDAPS